MNNFPRLLVVTEFPPNSSGGGPAVVRQMLKDWPVENLFWWSCLPETNNRFGQGVQTHRCAAIPQKLYPNKKFATFKSALLEHFWTKRAASHLTRTLQELKPGAVWVIPHQWSIPPLAKALIGQYPSYHITIQDYVDIHENPRRFGYARCKRMATMADQLYAGAMTRDATSHPMIADLRARTGADAAQMLHAGLERVDFEFLAAKTPTQENEIRIAYAGTIIVEKEFEFFVKALAKIRSGLARPLKLELFGAHSYASRDWFEPSWMRENGNLSETELGEILRECTWGFAPMALTDDDPRYNQFSFPTKFISYLAAGLPVITLGHSESSVVKMAQTYNVGTCVTSGDPENLRRKLLEVLSIENPWRLFGQEILRCTRKEYDAAEKRRKLYRCFSDCVRVK